MRVHMAGAGGLPNIKEAAVRYKAIKADNGAEFQLLQKLGRSANIAGKIAGKKGRNSFGMTTRMLQRRQQQSRVEVLFQQVCGMSPSEQAAAILQYSKRNGQGLGHALKLVIAVQRMEGAKGKKELLAAQQVLEEWQDSIGKRQKASLLQRLPQLSVIDLVPVPNGDLHTFEVDHTASINKAKVACGWAMEHGRAGLGTLLSKYWEGQHMMLEPKQCASLKRKLPAAKDKSPCCAAGVCLCSPQGKLLSKVFNRFARLLKEKFQSKGSKLLLANGKIVVRFSTQPGVACTEWLEAPSHNPSLQLLIFGIPLMYFKPYRPTFEVLAAIEKEVEIYVGRTPRAFVKDC